MKKREGRKVEGRGGGMEGKGSVPPLLFNNLTTYSNNNNAKYTEIMGRYDFEATAIESLGGFSLLARQLITLRANCGAMYCNRSCLSVCLFVGGSVITINRNCLHRSSPNWVCR